MCGPNILSPAVINCNFIIGSNPIVLTIFFKLDFLQDFAVESTEVHPDYNPANFRNDVSLVRLASKVIFKEHIAPVCLPVTLLK